VGLFRGALLEIVGRGCSVVLDNLSLPQSAGLRSFRVYWKRRGLPSI